MPEDKVTALRSLIESQTYSTQLATLLNQKRDCQTFEPQDNPHLLANFIQHIVDSGKFISWHCDCFPFVLGVVVHFVNPGRTSLMMNAHGYKLSKENCPLFRNFCITKLQVLIDTVAAARKTRRKTSYYRNWCRTSSIDRMSWSGIWWESDVMLEVRVSRNAQIIPHCMVFQHMYHDSVGMPCIICRKLFLSFRSFWQILPSTKK